VNLEIALSGVSAKVKPPNRFFSPAEDALKRRVNVIKENFVSIPDSRILDLSRTSGHRRETRLFLEIHPFDR
jgi:hypothetical protein